MNCHLFEVIMSDDSIIRVKASDIRDACVVAMYHYFRQTRSIGLVQYVQCMVRNVEGDHPVEFIRMPPVSKPILERQNNALNDADTPSR